MITNFRSLLVLPLFFISCGGGDEIPPGILQKEKIVKVLTSIHLAEAEQQRKVNEQTATSADTFSFSEIFKQESITKQQYDSSMKFYSAHPQILDQMYDEVINELNKMQMEETKKK